MINLNVTTSDKALIDIKTSKSLLPPNATPQENQIELAASRISDVAVPIKHLWDPLKCPEHLLPWLAWALSVDEWDNDWPVAIQREVIASSTQVHRTKGTVSGVRKALASLNASIELSEWWQNGGVPHTAKLTALARNNLTPSGDTLLTPQLQAQLWRIVSATKPVRSNIHFSVGVQQDKVIHTSAIGTTHNLSRQSVKTMVNNDFSASSLHTSQVANAVGVSRTDMLVQPNSQLKRKIPTALAMGCAFHLSRASMHCQ
ncbi:phage tail protein I [Pseudoalteromonas denitrificans]|uniref:Phage tail protein, P2 protein I family n=1 Tax=Pseudoalteromonas denitrificans DSM 6059 TaxID=1123010 RepID=A0A1I1QA98_9GAMM|nr:phage tail protein I [Pseudoalteromonas denitrificans]SFD16768.1 phage tail protein, P2 protein I family [Pseudoalteromonas denitrificans DSM 6059]